MAGYFFVVFVVAQIREPQSGHIVSISTVLVDQPLAGADISLKVIAGRRTMLSRSVFLVVLLCALCGDSQQGPPAPNRPWHAPVEKDFSREAAAVQTMRGPIDPTRVYTLAELIDLAETQNPETRQAWQQARAQAATLGVARSELYPTLAAVAMAQLNRGEILFNAAFIRQTVAEFDAGLSLNYTVFDFGARSDRIDAAKAQLLGANFAFNDTHRRIIYAVEEAYYQLLNAAGQIAAAEASLTNALTVEQSADDRMNHGLATLPDVLEARSAAAEADYQLQAVRGTQDISHGELARALGVPPTLVIHIQPLAELATPDSMSVTVDQALDRAFAQRPDLMQQLAELRSAHARVKEARAAYYPTLNLQGSGGEQVFRGVQEPFPWAHDSQLGGEIGLSLTWLLFDGGARHNRLARSQDQVRAAQAQVKATRDRIAQEVWTAYSNLQTAFRELQSAVALLSAADQSYAAALDSYNHGLRSLLDVTAAQRTLARARSTDVLARTAVLSALAELAFQTGNSIQPAARRTVP